MRRAALLALAGALAANGCGGGDDLSSTADAGRCPERLDQAASDGFAARVSAVATSATLAVAGCGGDHGRPSLQEARRCLERLNLHVTPREPTRAENGTLKAELYVNDILEGRVQVSALYYVEEAAAEREEPHLRLGAQAHGGGVERHGSLILYWVGGDQHGYATPTRDCLL